MVVRIAGLVVALVGLGFIAAHHVGYFRRRRPMSFGAFLETGGWIIITLVALGAAGGAMADPQLRAVEIGAGMMGVLFLAIGSVFR